MKFPKDKTLYPYFLILPLYLITFFVVERAVPTGGFESYLPFDDKIPFIDIFVVPYILWYPFLFYVGLKLFFIDGEGFKRYMTFIGIGFFSIIILNFFFPNEQNLRVDISLYDSIFSKAVGYIYSADTNTNVCPSMHVVGALGALFAELRSKHFGKGMKIVSLILTVFITASTVFIKQHSILDIIVAIPYTAMLIIIVYKLIFRKRGKK